MSGMESYSYRGARALVLLHEQQLRAFVESWKLAKAADLTLPLTDDPDYKSLETLLYHVLRAARGYMIWICRQLDLPDPEIQSTPLPGEVEAAAGAYLDHVLERWRLPLMSVHEERFHKPEYTARCEFWDVGAGII